MAGGKFDLFIKEIFKESGKDLVTWLTGLTPLDVEPVRTELVVAEARQSNEIFRVRLPGDPPESLYLHLEVQTAGHPDMGRRMQECWTRAERPGETSHTCLPIPIPTTTPGRKAFPCFGQGNGLLLPSRFDHPPEGRACLEGNVLPILTLDSDEEHGRPPMASNDDSISLGDLNTFPDPFLQVPYRDRLQRISSSVLWGGLSRTLLT